MISNSLTWELTHPNIDGLDYVAGNTYRISAKKSNSFPLFEYPKYELVEIQQIFKSHEPYSWKSLCVPGYHTWDDNTPACVKSSSVDKLLERGFTLVKSNNDSPYR